MFKYEFSPEVYDLAWQAAQACNEAFDRLSAASISTNPEQVDSETIALSDINDDNKLLYDRVKAQLDFEALGCIAGVVMSTELWTIESVHST